MGVKDNNRAPGTAPKCSIETSLRLSIYVFVGILGLVKFTEIDAWSSSTGITSSLTFSRGRLSTTSILLQTSSNSGIDSLNVSDAREQFYFQIQKCQYADLNPVSDIIMDSFYDNKTTWRRLLKLSELNRLQQNFPYVDTDLHQMFVAVETRKDEITPTKPRTIVGFVDIDARPCRPEIRLPRPYLSDLAVHPGYRRRGIAKALVEACEDFCRNIPRQELYIRVEESNQAAMDMYMEKLQYRSQGIEVTREKNRVMTLHKSFLKERSKSGSIAGVQQIKTSLNNVQSPVVQAVSDEPEFII